MAYIEIPEIKRVRGKEALEALNSYIQELEKHGDKTLTEKQTKALIKFAKGLMNSIEAQQVATLRKKSKKSGLIKQLKKALIDRLPDGDYSHERDKGYALPTHSPLVLSSESDFTADRPR